MKILAGLVWSVLLVCLLGCDSSTEDKKSDLKIDASDNKMDSGTNTVDTTSTENQEIEGGDPMSTITITSPAFEHGGAIPDMYTCQGDDASVPLDWTGVPAEAKSLALIVDDPDAPDPAAPKMVWVHWVLYNIPPLTAGLEDAIVDLPEGTLEGLNDWDNTGWGGPCPPTGEHRYFFKLYALDKVLEELQEPTKTNLLAAMEGHIIAKGELMGTYQK